jgi:ketosteroid isomerase-like protein
MSQENLELARRFTEAGKRGDIEAALEFVAEDVVATDLTDPLDAPNVFHGREGCWAPMRRSRRSSMTTGARWTSMWPRATGSLPWGAG